jgi:hypothetical protein
MGAMTHLTGSVLMACAWCTACAGVEGCTNDGGGYMKRPSQFALGVFAGTFASAVVHGIFQDAYGGREGYIQHLKTMSSWEWLDPPWSILFIVACVIISTGCIAVAVFSRRE